MQKFQPVDRVRLVDAACAYGHKALHAAYSQYLNMCGTVVEVKHRLVTIQIDYSGKRLGVFPWRLEDIKINVN